MSLPRHSNQGDFCPACEEKLKEAHPEARSFFHFLIVNGFRDCHISCGWRGEAEQNADFASGRSEKAWPNSNHNFMKDGKPCSLALDLFRELPGGGADFPHDYYFAIFLLLKSRPEFSIRWGGDFREEWEPGQTLEELTQNQKARRKKTFIDSPHFELKGVS